MRIKGFGLLRCVQHSTQLTDAVFEDPVQCPGHDANSRRGPGSGCWSRSNHSHRQEQRLGRQYHGRTSGHGSDKGVLAKVCVSGCDALWVPRGQKMLHGCFDRRCYGLNCTVPTTRVVTERLSDPSPRVWIDRIRHGRSSEGHEIVVVVIVVFAAVARPMGRRRLYF